MSQPDEIDRDVDVNVTRPEQLTQRWVQHFVDSIKQDLLRDSYCIICIYGRTSDKFIPLAVNKYRELGYIVRDQFDEKTKKLKSYYIEVP